MEQYQKGTSQYLQFIALDQDGKSISGLNPGDVTIQIYRDTDNNYLDAISNVFIGTGGTIEHNMVELGSTGVYRFLFDQSIDTDEKGVYTIVYSIKTPFEGTIFDTATFYDKDLAEIRGAGWDIATSKPTLMNLANKNINKEFDPLAHSQQALAEIQTLGSSDNFNSEAI